MKLLYITNGITGAGGLERVLSIKTNELINLHQYEIYIITLNEFDIEPFYFFNPKIHFYSIKTGNNAFIYSFRYINELRKKVRIISPDIIDVCDDGLKGLVLPFLLGFPCPMVYERHVSKNIFFHQNQNILTKNIIKIQLNIMDYFAAKYHKFVILSEGTLAEWKLNNIEIIPNPVSFYPEQSSTLLNKKVIAVGKQSYQKGYDTLINIWAEVIKVHPTWNLEIYGKFDDEIGLEKLIKKLNITKNVTFFEPTKNIKEKYLEASIYCMTSRFEGFPMVLLEAMACGVPCISFKCPTGPEDIISDGLDGFLIEDKNSNQFRDKLILLIENEMKRLDFGKMAKINISKFSVKSIVDKWDELFNLLVKIK
jgi:glycosyltransferase involved in cell wall biosynthesis